LFNIYALALLGAFALYFWPALRRNLHLLQLSGYYAERFLTALKADDRKEASFLMVGLIVANLGLRTMFSLPLFLLLHAGVFLILGLRVKKRPEKKPLVFTWRIKRLLTAILLLCVAAIIGLALLFPRTYWWELPFLLGFLYLMLPAVAVVANLLSQPLEKRIAAGFIADGKKRLARHPGLLVIGVTGSFGKTSVKFLLSQLLSEDYQVLMTPESYNTPMGVVRTIRERLRATHQVFVVEMGARKPGDIRELCEIVKPGWGVITAVGDMHLETFGSLARVGETKFELAAAVGQDGVMFLNWDNDYIRGQKLTQPTVRYGLGGGGGRGEDLDVRAVKVVSGPEGSAFDLRLPGGETIACQTRLLGRHNVLNITAAAAVAARLGMAPERLAQAIGRLTPVPHRLQLLPGGDKYRIIDDAYNANPEGARHALETLGGFEGYKVLITPGMVELGEQEEELNRRLGRQAAKYCDFIIVVGRSRSFPILDGARRAGFDEDALYTAADIQAALAKADQLAAELEPEEGPMYVLLENDLPDNYSG
jgi:UDP-N-acetylmuramoyl-tripeptide--D-alanyl-D-alanine ligase